MCGPGLGEGLRKGVGSEEKALVLVLPSDPHCDLAISLERFVHTAASIQGGDSGDTISRAVHIQFI